MATIVQHRRTGDRYILLSVNPVSGANPSRFLSELFAGDKTELSGAVTLCDSKGNLFLANMDDVFAIEIDGEKVSDLIPEPTYSYNTPPSSYSYSQTDREDAFETRPDWNEDVRTDTEQKPKPPAPDKDHRDFNDDELTLEDIPDDDWI